MQSLESKNLLVLAPHMKVFIKDQTTLVQPFFDGVTVLIPLPRFSKMVLTLPYAKRHFDLIRQTVESDNESDNPKVLFAKFFTLPIETMRRRNSALATRSCTKKLVDNNIEFDLIHAHFLELGYVGVSLKERYNKPLVVTAHGSDIYDHPFRDRWYETLAKYVLNKTDQVITVSQFNATKSLSLGVSSNKLHVIYNGYDEQIFKPMSTIAARKRLDLPLRKKILVSVGNLADAKGHTYLIDAISEIHNKSKNILLIVIGSGPLQDALQRKVKRLGLEDKVLFVGRKMHCTIPIWMNACDIFVLPSIREGFPTVIPEAMACGKPVVATKAGGIQEAVSDNNLGILVNPKDPKALASAILEALQREWEPETILNNAKKYSWSNLTEQIVNVYRKALLNWEN